MSNLGFQTIYRLFNEADDVVCERVFLPPKQTLAGLALGGTLARHHRIAVSVRDFDLFAFSLSFERDYTTSLRCSVWPACRPRPERRAAIRSS